MGRSRSDHLDLAKILEALERIHQVCAVPVDKRVTHLKVELLVHPGQGLELRLVAGPDRFLAGELDGPVEPCQVTLPQQRVEKHGGQSRSERKRQAEIDAVFDEAFEHHEKPHIGFRNGFEKPALFERLLVLRMADKRKVRMQHQGEIALRLGVTRQVDPATRRCRA